MFMKEGPGRVLGELAIPFVIHINNRKNELLQSHKTVRLTCLLTMYLTVCISASAQGVHQGNSLMEESKPSQVVSLQLSGRELLDL